MLFKSIALAALAAVPLSEAAGCYPVWRSGGEYSSGSLVSATVSTTTSNSDGTTTTTSEKKNFKCTSGSQPSLSHCPSYDPSNTNQNGGTWSDEGACDGSQPIVTPSPTAKPTFAQWSGTGCPKAWVSGGSYEPGELAEVDGVVYKCSTAQFVNAWCGNPSYKPGDSNFWEQAWSRLGSCVGTIAPSASPVFVSLPDAGGCPDEYASGTSYEEGDKVTVNSIVYQCRSWPNSAWCSMDGYNPDGVNSADAWTRLGYCDGTIAPTTAPAFTSLTLDGGCPPEYSSGGGYEAGDKVSVDTGASGAEKVVYECSSDVHYSRYCNDYEPGHWSKLGWTLVGYCEGTIAPTTAPAFSALPDHNGCPNAYNSGTEYEADDKVAVEITSSHSVVYQCSGDVHQARYCSQYEPGNDYNLGWKLIGYCEGTIAPTTAPVFSSLTVHDSQEDGCPKEYNVATTYEEGDRVSVFVSDTPDRAVVYECKSWPNNGYCNAGPNYAPDSDNANMGWTLKGYCIGTIAPTAAPIVYPNPKCRWYNGTQPVIIYEWSASALSSYVPGIRVRKHDRIYKCKGWPNGLWCKMAVYEPEEGTYWNDAWTRAGDCLGQFAPTTSPSLSPTKNPTKSPSLSPSDSPSTSPSDVPSTQPSSSPSDVPSTSPSSQPSSIPSSSPSDVPSSSPSDVPSMNPSSQPSSQPSSSPSDVPSMNPSSQPSAQPSAQPTG